MADRTPSQWFATGKVREALRHVEDAQQQLELAAQELSSVTGVGKEWRTAGALTDRARKLYSALFARIEAGAVDLDPSARAHVRAATSQEG